MLIYLIKPLYFYYLNYLATIIACLKTLYCLIFFVYKTYL